jgi:hypothetical protein
MGWEETPMPTGIVMCTLQQLTDQLLQLLTSL